MRIHHFLLFFFCVATAHAEPKILQVEGRLSQGESIVVHGRDFGVKSVPGPVVFETAEEGAFSPRWSGTGDLSVSDGIQRHRFSHHNARLNFRPGSTDGSFSLSKEASSTWFLSYWFRIEPNWNWGTTDEEGRHRFLSRLQMVRLRDRLNAGEDIQILIDAPGNRVVLTSAGILPEEGTTLTTGIRAVLTKRKWHQFQLAFHESSDPGREDGTLIVWLDGMKIVARDNLVTRKSDIDEKSPSVIGLCDLWGPNKAAGEWDDPANEFLLDDVYVDKTMARVELGDRPTYKECAHREIQPADSWSDQRISFHVNQGSFGHGTPVFLFVHDAQGRVNETGWPCFSGDEAQAVKNQEGPSSLMPETDRISLLEGTRAEFGRGAFDVRIYDTDGTLIVQKFRTDHAPLAWEGETKDAHVRPGRYLCKITGLWSDVAFHSIEVNP